jgi:hypothetical protein
MAFACALAFSAPSNASFSVTPGFTTAIPTNNDFQSDLSAVGLQDITTTGASIMLNGSGTVQFDYMGDESLFNNEFTAAGVATFVENNKEIWGPVSMGSATFSAGAFHSLLFTDPTLNVYGTVGSGNFAIFLPANLIGNYNSNVIYFAFDDTAVPGVGIDSDYDDFVVRATFTPDSTGVVPEPASWAMMIIGFGLTGQLARRRRNTLVTS